MRNSKDPHRLICWSLRVPQHSALDRSTLRSRTAVAELDPPTNKINDADLAVRIDHTFNSKFSISKPTIRIIGRAPRTAAGHRDAPR